MGQEDVQDARLMSRFLKAILFGSLSGSVAIIIAVIAELRWECMRWNRGCYDGQGGIVLIVLVPIMLVVGGLLGAMWAWLRPKLEGADRQPRAVMTGLPFGFWCLVCITLFGLLIYLDRS